MNHLNKIFIIGIATVSIWGCGHQQGSRSELSFADARDVVVGGILGEAIDANLSGRLTHFITDENSPAIQLFNRTGPLADNPRSWRGEHAGKWLCAASFAVSRTGNPDLKNNLIRVADFLVDQQEENGYLGCYEPSIRYTNDPVNDSIVVGWDVWINAYMMKGLVAAYRCTGNTKYLRSAERIADLMYDTFITRGLSLPKTGHHAGMVGTGTAEPLVELYEVTGNPKQMELIELCVHEMEHRPGLGLLSKAETGMDVALMGNGKIYELLRNFLGLAKLYRITGRQELLTACMNAWENIRKYHLNPCGGPWGGVAVNAELFNRDCCFSPYGVNETCATMEWIRFSTELLAITGNARYAEEIEKSFYNALIGAQKENGTDWIYYTRLNGIVGPGNPWSCCWSSGMMALEDIPRTIYASTDKTIYVNFFAPSEARIPIGKKDTVAVSQQTSYPHDGRITITLHPDSETRFTLKLRIPAWCGQPEISIDGRKEQSDATDDGYMALTRKWKGNERIEIDFPMELRTILAEREYEDGGKFPTQYIGHKERYAALARGPLVYVTSHPDTFEQPDPIYADLNTLFDHLETEPSSDSRYPEYRLETTGSSHLFVPYYIYSRKPGSDYRTIWIRHEYGDQDTK